MTTSIPGQSPVHTIDLNFRGISGAIAVYMMPHTHGVVLVECGPGSTLPALQAGLQAHGYSVADVTDVLLTHIHLDHGGAAGWLARQGARIHVHPVGAPHLANPEKLLASAQRIYGDMMTPLWGEFLSVPEERLSVLEDGQVLEVGGLCFQALDTPGHAYHHYAYVAGPFEGGGICFTGDIGGVRMRGLPALSLPMPPPEFNLELWRKSMQRLEDEYARRSFRRMAPTHFGVFDDPDWHLAELRRSLDVVEAWILEVMPSNPSVEALAAQFSEWARQNALAAGSPPAALGQIEAANPAFMSGQGIYRYWHKVRNVA